MALSGSYRLSSRYLSGAWRQLDALFWRLKHLHGLPDLYPYHYSEPACHAVDDIQAPTNTPAFSRGRWIVNGRLLSYLIMSIALNRPFRIARATLRAATRWWDRIVVVSGSGYSPAGSASAAYACTRAYAACCDV